MLQSASSVFVVYRRKTLTGSPDPTHANGTNKPCTYVVDALVAGLADQRELNMTNCILDLLEERRKFFFLGFIINYILKS